MSPRKPRVVDSHHPPMRHTRGTYDRVQGTLKRGFRQHFNCGGLLPVRIHVLRFGAVDKRVARLSGSLSVAGASENTRTGNPCELTRMNARPITVRAAHDRSGESIPQSLSIHHPPIPEIGRRAGNRPSRVHPGVTPTCGRGKWRSCGDLAFGIFDDGRRSLISWNYAPAPLQRQYPINPTVRPSNGQCELATSLMATSSALSI